MAIDPTTTTTIRVGQLGSAAFNSTDLVPHEVSGTLKKGTLQDLATFIGSIISVDVSVGFRAVQVNDGETLPATDQQEFILVGPGTYPNVGGGATITTTGALNALVSNGVFWFIGVEIPIEVSAIWGDINGVLSDQTDLNDILVAKADLIGGKVPNSQLPSYVDDVIEVNDYASLPGTGETGKIYVTKDTGNIYRWSGSAYIRIADESPVWGIITGTLSDQTDLQNALDGKFDVPTGDTTQYIAGDGSLVTFPIAGQAGTLVRLVLNNSGSTIAKGSVVYINGASGNKPTIAKAIATGDSTSAQTFGLVQADITNNSSGYVVVSGDLIGLNTSGITEGTQLYLSSTTAGEYTTTKQSAPAHLVYVGVVTRSHATLGQIEVKIQNGYELDELHDVAISSKTNKDFLVYESSTNLWKNKSLGTILGGSSSQFLKGDGSLDSTVYLKGSLSANYIPRSLYPGSGDMTNSSIYDNTNGAIGIGVVPSDWDTAWKVLQISKGSYYASDYSNRMGYNLYEIGENTKYISSNLASLYEQNSGSHYWYTAPSGTAGANMTLTPRMILDNSGKLGIGTTSPSGKLHIKGGNNDSLYVDNDGSQYTPIYISNNGSVKGFTVWDNTNSILQFGSAGANPTAFYTNSAERMRITSGGNVGIGTTSPLSMLHAKASGYPTLTLEGSTNSGAGIRFFGDVQYAEIFGEYQSSGNGQMFFRTRNAGTISTAMTILGSGNVGIGTTSPATKFAVSSSGTYGLEVDLSGSNIVTLQAYNRSTSAYVQMDHDALLHRFNAGGSERMRITSGGNVLIGTTTDSGDKLHINGTIRLTGTDTILKLHNTNGTPQNWWIGQDTSGTGNGVFYIYNSTSGVQSLNINKSNNATFSGTVTASAFIPVSDMRLKDLIDYNYNVELIKPITYTWKDSNDKRKKIGYSAQQVQEFLPEVVNTDEKGMLSVDYNQIFVAKIDMLENMIKELKAEIEILKNK